MIADNELFACPELPRPPEWLVQQVLDSVDVGYRENRNVQFETRAHTQQEHIDMQIKPFILDGSTHQRAIYRRYELDEQAAQWVRENIGPYSQLGSQLMRDGSAFTPHTDGGPRRYIANYIIDAGGSEVRTQWFREPGYDLIREGKPLQFPMAVHLELVKSTVFPSQGWSVIFGKVIHAVTNMTSPRIQISISFSDNEFQQLKERWAIDLKYYG